MEIPQRAQEIIEKFNLKSHPEGGFYAETYRSSQSIPGKDRQLLTSIYFLITGNSISRFHRIQSDECWYFHEGSPLLVHSIFPNGEHQVIELGLDLTQNEVPFHVVPALTIFGSHLKNDEGYAFVSCAVAPGFDFADFELFTSEELMKQYPDHQSIITKLT
ncbi:cupin domain-containing protein [Fluviicola taffensis]|uniref:cupin domain-containing protein n=1 Tax=Fluviicola taffensis TaxID=191579 RepID=UPI003137A6BA